MDLKKLLAHMYQPNSGKRKLKLLGEQYSNHDFYIKVLTITCLNDSVLGHKI